MKRTFLVLLGLCLGLCLSAEKKSKTVSSLLNAKWNRTPFLLETSEFLATENNQFFWDFLEYFSEPDNVDLKGKITDQELYGKLMEFCSRYLSPAQIKLLKFELALHTNSPKIEMFQQIASDQGVHKLNCETVIDFNGKLSCDFTQNFGENELIQTCSPPTVTCFRVRAVRAEFKLSGWCQSASTTSLGSR